MNNGNQIAGFYMDLIRIEYFHTMIDKKPLRTSEVKDKSVILKVVTLHNKIPAEGSIYMKLAPTSSLYKIKYFNNGEIIKTIKIYNNRVQCTNTAFAGEENKYEKDFVKFVKALTEKN